MEEVNLNVPKIVVENKLRIKPDSIGYCELHGNPMKVKYLEAYQGELWVGHCGCSSNWIPNGYEYVIVRRI